LVEANRNEELRRVVPERPGFRKRFLSPVLLLFSVMAGSWVVYNLAWRLEDPDLHQVLASTSGTLLFLSVALGTLFIYPATYLRGAPLTERVIASLTNPLLWATKECVRLSVSFSFPECLYYYLNPLNLWLLSGICAQMALAEILCRRQRRCTGEATRVLEPVALGVLVASLFTAVSLFGAGTGIPVPASP
jgi:hypothetical protein